MGLPGGSMLPGAMPNLTEIFSSEWFMPHGHCYRWEPGLVWLQVLTNGAIGVAYAGIAFALTVLVRRVRDIPFKLIYLAFGAFILSCGVTHLMDVVTIWKPLYWVDGGVRAITAAASVGTAFLLPPLVPRAVALARGARAAHERGIELEAVVKELATLYDRARELEALKTQFFANVSHELRTPLALILGPTETLLAAPELSGEHRAELRIVQRNARQLLREVDDLLEVSRLEAGRTELERSPLDLAATVRDAVEGFRSLARERGLEIRVDTPPRMVGALDPSRVLRIVLNLLSNAFKFTPHQGTVRVSLREDDVQPARAVLEVADSGPGIPEPQREAVFERFRQLDLGNTRRFGGVGIGLALARDLTRAHGGELTVTTAPEGGALFRCVLPLPPVQPGARPVRTEASAAAEQMAGELSPPPEARGVPAQSPEGKPAVLVVEDNPEMGRHVADVLAPDAAVQVAIGGQAGVSAALASPPDLVVTDLMMPDLSGDTLVQTLRSRPATATVPVLILTARADVETRARLLRDGAQDYLVKPFAAEELRARARNLLEAKRASDLLRGEVASGGASLAELARHLADHKRRLETALATLEVARDRALTASEAKSAFLNLVSHELRTPLTAVRLQVDRLVRAVQRSVTPPADAIRRLDATTQRFEDRMMTLLEYARLQSGRLVLAPQPVELRTLLEDVLDELRPEAELRQLALRLEAADPVTVTSDPRLLRLVVNNLVSNAIKYTEAGSVTVGLLGDGPGAVLSVRDTGRGIASEAQERIFEPFVQLEPLLRKHTPGVGLGLAIVRELVGQLQGRLSLESIPGVGSSFHVRLPGALSSPV
ncbi:MAG: response regulator [Myxococcaceae bacterium]|nr:MAG: response regulator [Myxococcaceae bacterium]